MAEAPRASARRAVPYYGAHGDVPGTSLQGLLALKWSDLDWENLALLVPRAVVGGHVDGVLQDALPLDPALGELLLNWKLKTEFNKVDGWVFASPVQAGKNAVWSLGVQQRGIKPAAEVSRFGCWPPLAHLSAYLSVTPRRNRVPLKVQQELMRHASIGATMNIYGAAMTDTKREANSKVVSMVLGA